MGRESLCAGGLWNPAYLVTGWTKGPWTALVPDKRSVYRGQTLFEYGDP